MVPPQRRAPQRLGTGRDSFCDADGWPVDVAGYEQGKAARDTAAWEPVETFLAHGPAVLAEVRGAVTTADYLGSPINEDLARLRGIDSGLARAGQIRSVWEHAEALVGGLPRVRGRCTSSGPASSATRGLALRRRTHLQRRGVDQGSSVHLTGRIGADRPAPGPRVQAALSRSAATPTAASPTSPILPAAPIILAARPGR